MGCKAHVQKATAREAVKSVRDNVKIITATRLNAEVRSRTHSRGHRRLTRMLSSTTGRSAMLKMSTILTIFAVLTSNFTSNSQAAEQVVDVPTRPHVTQRLLVLAPENPKAVAILLPGGHGGLQIAANGSLGWGKGNFLVRSRQLFADQGLLVAIVDAPSDRQAPPYLSGFRGTREHIADLKAVIAWARKRLDAGLACWHQPRNRIGRLCRDLPHRPRWPGRDRADVHDPQRFQRVLGAIASTRSDSHSGACGASCR